MNGRSATQPPQARRAVYVETRSASVGLVQEIQAYRASVSIFWVNEIFNLIKKIKKTMRINVEQFFVMNNKQKPGECLRIFLGLKSKFSGTLLSFT